MTAPITYLILKSLQINTLPFSAIDKEEQLAILYQQQKKYTDAEKLWEHRILKGVTEIQTALINMLEIALHENRDADTVFLQIGMNLLLVNFLSQNGCDIMLIY